MGFFNHKIKKENTRENICIEDVDAKIEDRLKEKSTLEKILRGMRSEVASLMEKIKELSDKIKDYSLQQNYLENNIELLNQDYLKLLNDFESEKKSYLILQEELNNLNNEMAKLSVYNDRLSELRTEHELLKSQITEESFELDKIRTEKFKLLCDEAIQRNKNYAEPVTLNKAKRCSVITKSGKQCKRNAEKDSDKCQLHRKKS